MGSSGAGSAVHGVQSLSAVQVAVVRQEEAEGARRSPRIVAKRVRAAMDQVRRAERREREGGGGEERHVHVHVHVHHVDDGQRKSVSFHVPVVL